MATVKIVMQRIKKFLRPMTLGAQAPTGRMIAFDQIAGENPTCSKIGWRFK